MYLRTNVKYLKQLESLFYKISENPIKIISPGRINLIGEHIDYHGGFVLPAAINKAITLDIWANDTESEVNIFNKNFDEKLIIDINNLNPEPNSWLNYVKGVIHYIKLIRPNTIKGFNIILESNLPIGSGLSSSAALECAIGKGLDELFNLDIPPKEMIQLCQKAEWEFANTKCGIMDQFSVYMSKKNCFTQLNCETLQYELLPYDITPYEIILINTNVTHSLSDGSYNDRRNESENAFKKIASHFTDIKNLANVTAKQLNSVKDELLPVEFSRAKHVIEEQQRVISASKKIEEQDIKGLGNLLYKSHESLRALYEVSCNELDFLVDYAKSSGLVIGSRMMGGGFGGSTINIIHKDNTEEFIFNVGKAYQNKFNTDSTAIRVTLEDGTHQI